MELRVGGKYRLGRKIGSGSFGDIYLGECREREIGVFEHVYEDSWKSDPVNGANGYLTCPLLSLQLTVVHIVIGGV